VRPLDPGDHPRPNVDLPPSKQSLRLDFGPEVLDAFKAPSRGGVRETEVTEWRTTLARGFQGAFDASAPLVWGGGPADRVLQIVEASLELAPAAVSVYGVVAVTAHVRYKARLLDAQGNVLRRSTRTVSSKRATTDPHGTTTVAADAVASMFEAMAQDLFGEPAAK
jgi:hypothetical protein